MKLNEFITTNNITATFTPTDRGNFTHPDPGAKHYIATLKHGDGARFSCRFTVGSAWTEAPTVEDLMDCLRMDLAIDENDEYADLGVTREAANKAHEQAERFRSFLGDDVAEFLSITDDE